MFRDVLAAVSRREKKSDVSGDGDNKSRFNSMRISELRRESHEKGLNEDGSREMLIAALKRLNGMTDLFLFLHMTNKNTFSILGKLHIITVTTIFFTPALTQSSQ